MRELVIVSNRGPFTFSTDFLSDAEKALRRGERPKAPKFGKGGLVQAMAGLLKTNKWRTTWIGASMGDKDIDVARGHYRRLFDRMRRSKLAPDRFPLIEIDSDSRMHFRFREYDFYMRFVFFDTRHMYSYYNRFANEFLWPLMHLTRSPLFYKRTREYPRPLLIKNDLVQYTSSCVTFANAAVDEIRKSMRCNNRADDIVVWNHDYHLMRTAEVFKTLLLEERLPQELRSRIHTGQFMHTPFFNIHEIQGLIREDKRARVRDQLYDPFADSIETALQKLTWGMLSNDFIGFHTKEYCDHYLEALEEWFPVRIKVNGEFYEVFRQDRVTRLGVFPIGLDVDNLLAEVSPRKTLRHRVGKKSLSEMIDNDKKTGKIIFGGLERCDYTKGLIQRVGIFAQTLKRLRAAGKEARFYQVTSPSRSESPDYQHLESLLGREIGKANKKLGSEAVVHLSKGIFPPQNYRFLKEVEVMFVTPLEDGMNLVAFEYILSQKHKRPDERGALILSTSGASRVLKEEGFGAHDGVIYVNPMQAKDASEKVLGAVLSGRRISERLVNYVERERRVDDWADMNIEAIIDSATGT